MKKESKLYTKKPVAVKAFQTDKKMQIQTLEGLMTAKAGDYIVTGVRGEKYPVDKEIFEETYEEID